MPDTTSNGASFVTRYRAPKMDCAAEERLIRLALEPVAEVRKLEFDLQAHEVIVWHLGSAESITQRLSRLDLGAAVIESVRSKAQDLAPSASPGSLDVAEARTRQPTRSSGQRI